MGYALVSAVFAEPYLHDGRVVRALDLQKHTYQALYVTCPDGPISYGAQMFLDWIVARSAPIRQL